MNTKTSEKQSMADAEIQLILFTIGGEKYALDIMKTKEIIKPIKVTPLPDVPAFIEGVINLRGMLIPVVSMRERFGISLGDEETESPDTRVIIIVLKKIIVGIVVDSVEEIMRLTLKDIQPPPRIASGIDSEYIKGMCRIGEEALVLLDMEKILSSAEKVMMEKLRAKGSKKT